VHELNIKEITETTWQGATVKILFNPLNADSNPICHLLALLGARPILHTSRIRVTKPYDLRFDFNEDKNLTNIKGS
jgi:hypothetical protein